MLGFILVGEPLIENVLVLLFCAIPIIAFDPVGAVTEIVTLSLVGLLAETKPIKFKRYKDGRRRPQYSYFRYGLDFIRESILQITTRFEQFSECLALIRTGNEQVLEAP